MKGLTNGAPASPRRLCKASAARKVCFENADFSAFLMVEYYRLGVLSVNNIYHRSPTTYPRLTDGLS